MRLWKGQKRFLAAQARHANVAFAASRGAGKTYALAMGMCLQAAAESRIYGVLAPRQRTMTGNVLLQLTKAGRDLAIPVRAGYYAEQRAAFIGDSVVCFFSGFNVTAIANFRGDSMGGFWLEEATLLTEDVFHAAESTLRDGDDPFLWLSYNRTTPTSWVKRLIEDGKEDELGNVFDFALVEARTEDNKYLPAAYLERLKRLPGHYRARDYENKWAAASGLVYPIWSECTCTFDPRRPYILAYDPAPVNTQAALCIQAQRDHFCIVAEIYTRHGATLRSGRDALDQIEARWGKPHVAVLDPAAYDHVHEATYYKHWTTLTPSTKEHIVTIPILRVLLEQRRLRVNPATCPNTSAELWSVVYDERREKIANEQEDHATDAMRYVSEFLEAEVLPMPRGPLPTFQDRWDEAYAARATR